MSRSPFFSVVIPTYNCGELLKKALVSVFTQTYQDFEIIVIDNSSTDNTKDVLKIFDKERLKVIELNNNGIIAISRNKGIENAIGEWIAFLDADDIWIPEKLEKVRNTIIDNSQAILFCHDEWYVVNGKRKNRLRYGPAVKNFYERLLFEGNCVSTSAVCLRRDIAINSCGFSERENFVTMEDYEYWIRLSELGDFFFINEVLGEWHIHSSNYSSNAIIHAEAQIAVLEHHFNLWLNKFPSAQRQVILGRSKAWTLSSRILQKGRIFSKAIQYAIKAICLNPFQWKAWGVLLLSLLRISIR